MFPEQNEGINPQEQGEKDAQRRYEFEKMGLYRREEYHNFPERNNPEQVRHEAAKVREFWIDQWYRRGVAPYDFIVEQSIIIPGRYRVEQLTDSLPSGLYTPTEEEKAAGLVEGVHWKTLPKDFLLLPGVKTENRNGQEVWTLNGKEIGLFGTDASEIQIYKDMGYDVSHLRPNLFIGREFTPEEATENREKLAKEIEVQTKQAEAWTNLLKKVIEQDIFASDLKAYVDDEFTRLGKEIMQGWAYGEIFNSPPTREGLAPFGEKLIVSLNAWREIIEGRAYTKLGFKDKETNETVFVEGRIPNPFADSKNRRLIDISLGYVQARVNEEKPIQDKSKEEEKTLINANYKDNKTVALAGLLLMDHFDFDANAAKDVMKTIREEGEIDTQLVYETAFSDSAKLAVPRTQRMNSFLGYTEDDPENAFKRRPHPRAAGSPISLRLTPNFASNFLEEVNVQVIGKRLEPKIKNGKESKTKKIRLTLDQISEGTRDENGNRIVYPKDGKRYSIATRAEKSESKNKSDEFEYELRPLSDRSLWDDVSVVKVVGEGRKQFSFTDLNSWVIKSKEDYKGEPLPPVIDYAKGTGSLPYEMPKGLFEKFVLNTIYSQFTRMDYDKMLEDYCNPQFLQGLNKGITLGMSLLATQHQLSEDTQRDLEEFVRIALLANCAAAVLRNEAKVTGGEKIEQQSQIVLGDMYDRVIKPILASAMKARFVITEANDPAFVKLSREKDRRLLDEILTRRDEAPLGPFDLHYFSKAQQAELEPLYK